MHQLSEVITGHSREYDFSYLLLAEVERSIKLLWMVYVQRMLEFVKILPQDEATKCMPRRSRCVSYAILPPTGESGMPVSLPPTTTELENSTAWPADWLTVAAPWDSPQHRLVVGEHTRPAPAASQFPRNSDLPASARLAKAPLIST